MLAVIGGTGLYQLDGLALEKEHDVKTPFGQPSARVVQGSWGGQKLLFLPRHGRNHELIPSEINFRANLFALKALGATGVLSISASGSLQKQYAPGDLALVSQYIDWTRGRRASTFFGEGLVAHTSTAQAACPLLTERIARAARALDISLHRDLTYVCVEGPRFGTRAESQVLRSLEAHIVGMTNVPEAFLAAEAQLAYVTLAIVTDYDCWLEDPAQHVSATQAINLYKANLGKILKLLGGILTEPLDLSTSPARKSLEFAVVTPEERWTSAHRELLRVLKA